MFLLSSGLSSFIRRDSLRCNSNLLFSFKRTVKSSKLASWPFNKLLSWFVFYYSCSIKKLYLNISQYSQKKHLRWKLFLIRLQAFRVATLLKRDSKTGFFLRILQNFSEDLFNRTTSDDFFWRVICQSLISEKNFAFKTIFSVINRFNSFPWKELFFENFNWI